MPFLGVWGAPQGVASSKESAQQGQRPYIAKCAKVAQNTHNKELEISDCLEMNSMHPFPSLECGEHHRVWPRQKKVYNKVKRTYSANCAKLAQNKYNKEREISDCFEMKPTHPCPSLEFAKHHRLWPHQKKVHNKAKWP